MPEAGYLPIPKKLAQRGVKDMVRISDARMSGTAFGTIVLHITPDAASGGPLGLVRNGDRIRLSVKERRIETPGRRRRVEAARCRRECPRTKSRRAAMRKLYAQEILGADEGCDFAFLRPPRQRRVDHENSTLQAYGWRKRWVWRGHQRAPK